MVATKKPAELLLVAVSHNIEHLVMVGVETTS